MTRILFFHPKPIKHELDRGSRLRPRMMLEAFRTLGYQVHVVSGWPVERKAAFEKVKAEFHQGSRFSFLYAESSNLPIPLCSRSKLPSFNPIDFQFLKWCAEKSISSGLFYRDIYWNTTAFASQLPRWKRIASLPFFQWELREFRRFIRYLFLPSLRMLDEIPGGWDRSRVRDLPPGGNFTEDFARCEKNSSRGIVLVYVGSLSPPLYDLRPFLQVLSKVETAQITLCCRKEEWKKVEPAYRIALTDRVRVVHASGAELKDYYLASDVSLRLSYPMVPYLKFVMPTKVFESVGYGVPVITNAESVLGDFVEKEGFGWTVRDPNEFKELVVRLIEEKHILHRAQQATWIGRKRHTWQSRAEEVASVLSSDKKD